MFCFRENILGLLFYIDTMQKPSFANWSVPILSLRVKMQFDLIVISYHSLARFQRCILIKGEEETCFSSA